MFRLIGVLGLGAALSGACGTTVNVEGERAALLARDRDWSDAAADTEQFVSFFTADAAVYQPGSPAITGTQAIREMHAGMSATPGFAISWTPSMADVSAAGDIGHTVGAYEVTLGGATEKGKYVTLWRKEGDQWMVTADIFNADGPPPATHAMTAPSALKWTDPPPGLPAGARVALVAGDPTQPVPFVLRAEMPAGYTVGPHWHPTTETVTVLSGTIAMSMGETMDAKTMTNLPVGGVAVMPAELRHSFLTRTAATIQVHGIGPFAITYVNAADDPRNK
jgi:ketosteroid isomerase-like protein